jgi:hypothetical protein
MIVRAVRVWWLRKRQERLTRHARTLVIECALVALDLEHVDSLREYYPEDTDYRTRQYKLATTAQVLERRLEPLDRRLAKIDAKLGEPRVD